MITETTEHLDGLLDDLLRVTDGERASVLIGVIGADMFPRFRHAEAVLAVASIMAELAIRSPEPELVMALTLRLARPGDTLFVWGFRPELYVYTGLPAASRFLDSQPLTGVPADRHLTQSEPLEVAGPAGRRAELARSHPAFVIDGLGLYNPRLAINQYPDLEPWLAHYREAARSGQSIIYQLAVSPPDGR